MLADDKCVLNYFIGTYYLQQYVVIAEVFLLLLADQCLSLVLINLLEVLVFFTRNFVKGLEFSS